MGAYHLPIMAQQVVELLRPLSGTCVVDCTVGGGGHARALLEAYPEITLVGLDRDAEAIAAAEERLRSFGQRKRLIHSDYRRLREVAKALALPPLAGILFDLGVSSHQLDSPERGFSYWSEGPLDMRMDPRQTQTAADLVNNLPEDALAHLIKAYGEERWARRIARFMVERRRERPIAGTLELVEVIKAAIPAAARRDGPHPARRTFQALRIAVNQELEGLACALHGAIDLLAGGGRVCVLAFHSLEDRVVKQVFRRRTGACECPPGSPLCRCGAVRDLKLLTKGAWQADPVERDANPRARSARLRAAERI